MSNKLYILVRGDLSKSQQAVQASHAVAEFMLRNNEKPNLYDCIHCIGQCKEPYYWENETIVLLKVKDLDELLEWQEKLENSADNYCYFTEPDIGHEMTAIAAYGPKLENLLKNLRLV